MRIIKNPEERKSDILDAAEQLFATKGYTKTTVTDILNVLDIAKGTFYYYFKSKEEVMQSVVNRYIHQGITAAKQIIEDVELSAHEKMYVILRAQNGDVGNKNVVIEHLNAPSNVEMHQRTLVEMVLQLSPILATVVKEGIEEGIYDTPAPQDVVQYLLVSSQFLLDEGIFQWSKEEIVQKAHSFAYIAEKALGAKQGSFSFIPEMYEAMTVQ